MWRTAAVALLTTGRLFASVGWAAPSSDPCSTEAYRALDFWVGSWTVLAEGRPVAESRIERLGAGCALLESYRQSDGYRGKSVNYLDPIDGRWHQLWMDSAGALSEFSGGPGAGGIELSGETRREGGRALRRMRLSPLEGARVRQSSQISRDDGRTWQPHYELEYVPGPEGARALPCSAPSNPQAEAGARAVAAGIVEADNETALPRVLSFYAEEAVLLPPGALPVAGIDAIRPRYERLFAEFTPAIELRIDRVCSAEGVAFVEGHNGGRLRRRDGPPDKALDDLFLLVVRRDASSRWRISHLAWW